MAKGLTKDVPTSGSQIMTFIRDWGGVATPFMMSAFFGSLGGLASIFVAPQIASSSNMESVAKGMGMLATLESFTAQDMI